MQRGFDALVTIFVVLIVISLAGYYISQYILYIIGGLVIIAVTWIIARAVILRRMW